MALLDVFDGSAFTMASLSAAIDKAPFQPQRLGQMGIFQEDSINTTVAQIEERHGTLAIIPSAARGTMNAARAAEQREVRPFNVPHFPYFQTILADDLLNIRDFGSESSLEQIGKMVNKALAGMRNDHEVTWEWQRINAIKGLLLDADGTVIYDWRAEFNGTPNTPTWDFTNATEDMKQNCTNVRRAITNALGSASFRGMIGLCGDGFFDNLVSHPTVTAAYERWIGSDRSAGTFLRQTQIGPDYSDSSMDGFPYGDIMWMNYRGQVGSTMFVDNEKAHVFPVGVQDMFLRTQAPANFVETVGTMGRPMYVKQRRLEFDTGIELFSQSNTLHICTRPGGLAEITGTLNP